ncbi:MAG TPA: hypothetical protein VJ986_11670 [Gaiellaceae bacterium]|nr:hypothetical protein [Gaiellaceae bacterium]
MNQTSTQMILRRASAQAQTCSCDDPIRVERAERKGAAVVVCLRCGLRVPARLR